MLPPWSGTEEMLFVQSGYLLAWARARPSLLGAAFFCRPLPEVDPGLLRRAPLGPQTAIPTQTQRGRDVEGL